MSPLNLTEEEEEKSQLVKIYKYTYNNSMRENRIRVILSYDKNMTREDIKDHQLYNSSKPMFQNRIKELNLKIQIIIYY